MSIVHQRQALPLPETMKCESTFRAKVFPREVSSRRLETLIFTFLFLVVTECILFRNAYRSTLRNNFGV